MKELNKQELEGVESLKKYFNSFGTYGKLEKTFLESYHTMKNLIDNYKALKDTSREITNIINHERKFGSNIYFNNIIDELRQHYKSIVLRINLDIKSKKSVELFQHTSLKKAFLLDYVMLCMDFDPDNTYMKRLWKSHSRKIKDIKINYAKYIHVQDIQGILKGIVNYLDEDIHEKMIETTLKSVEKYQKLQEKNENESAIDYLTEKRIKEELFENKNEEPSYIA